MDHIKYINIDKNVSRAYYLQIAESIKDAILNKKIQNGDLLPSINKVARHLNLSRDTVVKSYNNLRNEGIVNAWHGKNYYVKNTLFYDKIRIFLLFNELNEYKEIVYNAFLEKLGERGEVDIFFHHHDKKLFNKLIKEKLNQYHYYVIMPTFKTITKDIIDTLKKIPPNKRLILDRPLFINNEASVYQDFERDIYEGLREAIPYLNKYNNLNIILPEDYYHPKEAINGFKRFCNDFAFTYHIINTPVENWVLDDNTAHQLQNKVFVVFVNKDLVNLVKMIKNYDLIPGKDVGIISYNDNLLKDVIADGISVISTDFYNMGQMAANMILTRQSVNKKYKNPAYFKQRSSI